MKLPWQHGGRSPVDATVAPTAAQGCPTLGHALEALFRRKEKPEILDLGPLCGETLVYLADRGARVAVEEFELPPPRPAAGSADEGEDPPAAPLAIDQDDDRFDLVLAWEHFDFVDDGRLDELASELRRVLAPGGHLLLIAMNNSPTVPITSGRPARYRVIGDDQVVREELPGAAIQRWCRPTRDIERALAPLSVEKLHLHRNQTREFLAVRKSQPREKPADSPSGSVTPGRRRPGPGVRA